MARSCLISWYSSCGWSYPQVNNEWSMSLWSGLCTASATRSSEYCKKRRAVHNMLFVKCAHNSINLFQCDQKYVQSININWLNNSFISVCATWCRLHEPPWCTWRYSSGLMVFDKGMKKHSWDSLGAKFNHLSASLLAVTAAASNLVIKKNEIIWGQHINNCIELAVSCNSWNLYCLNDRKEPHIISFHITFFCDELLPDILAITISVRSLEIS